MATLMTRLEEAPDGPKLIEALIKMVKGAATTEDLDFVEDHFDVVAEHAPYNMLREATIHSLHGLSMEEVTREVESSLSSMSDDRRADFGFRLLDGLRQEGASPADIAREMGVGSPDPRHLSPQHYGKLIAFLTQTDPERLGAALALQPAMITVLGHPVVASVLMHLGNEFWGGEPLEREYPERPGQVPNPPHGPKGPVQYNHVPEQEWEQTTTGGRTEPRAKPPKSGPIS